MNEQIQAILESVLDVITKRIHPDGTDICRQEIEQILTAQLGECMHGSECPLCTGNWEYPEPAPQDVCPYCQSGCSCEWTEPAPQDDIEQIRVTYREPAPQDDLKPYFRGFNDALDQIDKNQIAKRKIEECWSDYVKELGIRNMETEVPLIALIHYVRKWLDEQEKNT